MALLQAVGGEIGSRVCVCWVPSAPYDSHYSGKDSYLGHVLLMVMVGVQKGK